MSCILFRPRRGSSRATRSSDEGPHNPDSPEDPETKALHDKIDAALRKLHNNLGHPPLKELLRDLRHSKASAKALERASKLRCAVCANHQRPTAPLHSNANVVLEFNEQIGVDVKYLPSWVQGQKIPCLNILDLATSLQVMVPLPKQETGTLVRDAIRDRWIAWAGPPQHIRVDP